MSVRIGEVRPEHSDPLQKAAVHVQASRAGVELLTSMHLTLQPVEARNYAALLVRGADEVERMRARRSDEHVSVPWTAHQVASLNAYQQSGGMHPFTGTRRADNSETVLIATPEGWVEAPEGPVVQTWAYSWMADWSWRA
jgi:hypothetical protein